MDMFFGTAKCIRLAECAARDGRYESAAFQWLIAMRETWLAVPAFGELAGISRRAATIRLKRPILHTFEHRGHKRAEAITHLTFEVHFGSDGCNSEDLVDEVLAALDRDSDMMADMREELCQADVAAALRFAYVDAGFRATLFIDAMLDASEQADVPTIDLSHLTGRKITHREIHEAGVR